ncbi:MAG TPA: type II toxin-antitoxin system VapC family toxin [Bryobacteraceae bacterium]|nr:type II toxin-antitoxin system VapC family toxin [Bryobacteraceae bacterium]
MSVLIDSDILIEVSRGRDLPIVSRWLTLARSKEKILYSPVSAAEIWSGALPGEFETTDYLFGSMTCLPIDGQTGRQAGAYLHAYRKSHGLRMADALIAAGAVLSGAALWTRNRKHFPMKEIEFY